MVLSLAGVVVGVIGWMGTIRHTRAERLVIAGVALSVATLLLNLVIAELGLESVTLVR
jgi:hypothetical protein